jgi:serine protease Do
VAPRAFRWRWDGDGKDHAFVLRDRLRLTGPRRLGLTYQELSDQLAAYFKVDGGLLVSEVDADGPAAKAGIKAGDVIVKYDGAAVESSRDLRDKLARAEPGSDVSLTVQRDGKPVDLKVTLGGETKVTRKKRGITT